MSIRKQIWDDKFADIDAHLRALDPDLYRYISDFAYEEVLARPGLDLKTREFLAITSLIGQGSPRELVTHLEGALHLGASETELREVVLQAAIFWGFPKALAAMKILHKLLRIP